MGDEQKLGTAVPAPKDKDWFAIPADWLTEIGMVPNVRFLRDGRPAVHRTHLPVLAKRHLEVAALCTPVTNVELDRNTDDVRRERERFDHSTEPLSWKLRPYQHVAREFLNARRGVLLADGMRLGKTVSVVASHELDRGVLLVVAPLVTREVWTGWFRKRWPGEPYACLTGRAYDPEHVVINDGVGPKREGKLEDVKLVFAHYDVLPYWRNMGRMRLAKLVFDEAHLISNGKSNRSKAAQILSTEADQVVAATGTPLWNKPAGLHSILTCINPGAWGKYYDFARRYADGRPGAYGFVANGVSNIDEFKARLSEIMLRRTWPDVVKDLPPIERIVEVVDLDEEQCYELEKSAEEIRDATALRTPIGELARYRRLVAALKMEAALEAAKRVLDGGESVVIWTWHKDVAHKLQKQLEKAKYASYVVTGEEADQDKREATLDQWRAKDPGALVINIGVGQAGIDLSHARHAIFCEIDWVPATVAQAEMRTFSPLRPMTSTFIVVDHRVDRALVGALTTKCELGDALGVPAAESAIGSLGTALGIGQDAGDMNRLMAAVLDGIEA